MMEVEDLELLERSLERATARHTGAPLDAALVELGWLDAASEDPRAAVPLFFSLQGAANVTSSAIEAVVAQALGRPGHAPLLPPVGEICPSATLVRRRLDVDGVSMRLADKKTVLVVAREADAHLAFCVRADSLPAHPIGGIDPALGLVRVRGELRDAEATGAVDWLHAVAAGQVALGHELVGASRRMLQMAVEHALAREQFGRPIAAFQAVRHRLAESFVATEAAQAMLEAAWAERNPGGCGNGEGDSRSRCPCGGAPLPAGPGRNRVHDRAPAAPLCQAHPRPRTTPGCHTVSHP